MIAVRDADFTLYVGDALEVLRDLPNRSVHMACTSPPFYGLRDYGTEGQIGLEPTPEEWVDRLVAVFREVRRVLRDDGTLWVEVGDSYGSNGNGGTGKASGKQNTNRGSNHDGGQLVSHPTKPKDLIGSPWLLAFALRADGWFLRSEIIWAKPNPMPESVTDRPTKAHSTVFLLSKSPRYYFDQEAVREAASENTHARYAGRKVERGVVTPKGRVGHAGWDGLTNGYVQARNIRSVWTIATQPYAEAHFATWPEKLCERMILAGCPEGGTLIDPFMGSGTTAYVARRLGRRSIGIELNPAYADLAARRMQQQSLLAGHV